MFPRNILFILSFCLTALLHAGERNEPRLFDFVDSFRRDPYAFRLSFFRETEPAYSMPDSSSVMSLYSGRSNDIEVSYTVLYSSNRILAYSLRIEADNRYKDSLIYALYLKTPNSMYYSKEGFIGINYYEETIFTDTAAACLQPGATAHLPDSADHTVLYLCSYFSGLEFGMGGTIGAYDLKNYELLSGLFRYYPTSQYRLLMTARNPVTRLNAAVFYLNNRKSFPRSMRKELDALAEAMKKGKETVRVRRAGCIGPWQYDMYVRDVLKKHKYYP